MKHPEELVAELVAAGLNSDTWGFYYGMPSDHNFEADELTYPVCFLNKPVRATVINTASGARNLRFHIGLLFVYMVEPDDTEPAKFTAAKVKAWDAARKFILRLRAYDSALVQDVTSEELTDIDHLFDINLAGVLVEVTYVGIDADPICLT